MGSTQFTVPGAFEALATALPERDALPWGDKRWSFPEMAERSTRLANHLRSRGPGARTERAELAGHESGQGHLGIYLYNRNEYFEAMPGAFRSRVAPFNVDCRYVTDELADLLDNASCRALVHHSSFAPTLAAVLDRVPGVEVLIQVDDGSGEALLPGAVDYETVIAEPAPEVEVEPSPDDLCILYAGGTTGRPRGCCGASTTSSCRPWAGGTSSPTRPSTRPRSRWPTPGRSPSRCGS